MPNIKELKTNKQFSEAFMAKIFLGQLTSKTGIRCFPRFQKVIPEVRCYQGRPDFIALTSPMPRKSDFSKIASLSNLGRTTSIVNVLSLLKNKAPRTKPYLIQRTNYSSRTINLALQELQKRSIVQETSSGSYTICSKWNIPKNEIWAFELKLNDWKRALFQAMQCKSYANRVVLVFPFSRERLIKENIGIFKSFRIGVMLFDPYSLEYSVVCKPYKNNPSRMHYLYTYANLSLD